LVHRNVSGKPGMRGARGFVFHACSPQTTETISANYRTIDVLWLSIELPATHATIMACENTSIEAGDTHDHASGRDSHDA
ncbi:hypothetical protein, partial [Caballeronia pedi]|uniref:hypothetical protein n=1 Tax=Caballeronia pedi TaxID=1777141 RepID=UPI001ABF3468